MYVMYVCMLINFRLRAKTKAVMARAGDILFGLPVTDAKEVSTKVRIPTVFFWVTQCAVWSATGSVSDKQYYLQLRIILHTTVHRSQLTTAQREHTAICRNHTLIL